MKCAVATEKSNHLLSYEPVPDPAKQLCVHRAARKNIIYSIESVF